MITVEPEFPGSDEYFNWLRTMPEVMRRLVESAAILCTKELPASLNDLDSEESVQALLSQVNALAGVYIRAKDLEVQWHAKIPPEEFQVLHEMLEGWSDTVRDGVREYLNLLTKMEEYAQAVIFKKDPEVPELKITFEPPGNVDALCRELSSLRF